MADAGRYLGIDVGTSGVRATVIDTAGRVVHESRAPLPAPQAQANGGRTQDAELWRHALDRVIAEIAADTRVSRLAIDGTSGTLLLTNARGVPLGPARMYNDASASQHAERIKRAAPPESGAHGATSPLARLVVMQAAQPDAVHALHQADWLAATLTGRFGLSDDNNALKLGWDPVARAWPAWLDQLGVRRALLPEVVTPGAPLGVVQTGPLEGTTVVAGTTDGCASFLATGARAIGDAVTALGSTLTVKLLSDAPIFAPAYGVYSHRLGARWLAGGASNSGGAALLRYFSAEQLEQLTPQLDPSQPVGRDWHPLPGKGERFPLNDPELIFEPQDRPADAVRFFQALLEGIADVEARGYALLAELGGPALRSVCTVGGGGANPAWRAIRSAKLNVPLVEPLSGEAAYGTALLARDGA